MSPSQRPTSQRSSASSSSSASTSSVQSTSSQKSWYQTIFGGSNDSKHKDARAEREKVEMWRVMSMGYENVGQYVDVGEWIGR